MSTKCGEIPEVLDVDALELWSCTAQCPSRMSSRDGNGKVRVDENEEFRLRFRWFTLALTVLQRPACLDNDEQEMENAPLHQQIAAMRQSFFDEEILDEHFIRVEKLDDDNPHFLEEVLTLYFRESTNTIAAIEQALETPSYNLVRLERPIHQLKGSSASIGAIKVYKEVNHAIKCCREDNLEGARAALERIKNEHTILRSKLESYFQMLRQAGPSETADRPK